MGADCDGESLKGETGESFPKGEGERWRISRDDGRVWRK